MSFPIRGTLDSEYKVVVLVRQDLKMSKGKTAAQVAHAAVGCALACKKKAPSVFTAWDSGGGKIVVLKVTDERELFEFKAIADEQRLINCLITDAGRTEIDPGSVTCLGIGPEQQGNLNHITGELKML
ncbi:MAG: peptidyl-tRNA hydrolase Pth2 [Methanomethylophilus sp.]|nr:peptidyl-tRNA hydrolase Pth2 [Methanomethylophilus sp.]MDD4222195.1 peptidyl-tRNA hydrolase Pth2 [Methanomethylophilus sp.]MDD4669007.1 peptidyl-tRNA hydrolase Pth2 [Methanomethylophilus sp.]